MWRCPNCNAENNDNFCSNCGRKRPVETTQKNPLDEEIHKTIEETNHKNYLLRKRLTIVSVIAASLMVIILSFSIVRGIFYQKQKTEKAEKDIIIETQEPLLPTQEPISEPTLAPVPEPITHYSDVREITNIGTSRTSFGDRITIHTTSRSAPQVQYLHNPERIVIDFPEFQQVIGGYKIGYSGNCFSDVRYANHDSYARIVIDLYAERYYTVDTYEDKCVVEIMD